VETIVSYFLRIASYNPLVVIVELFLIGLVVYWAVNFLEGTRGERLFHGVIFVLVAGSLILKIVVGAYHFERLEYLYRGFLIAVLIIAVAAFQPEIRWALIRIGRTRFLRGSSHRLARTVEEVVSAVRDLASTRTGAIIVVEQQVGLGEFLETGVPVDARVSAELLKTIFCPGAVLHDMAVVIQGDRIAAASVQLPLAEVGSVKGTELGSRHRAAIGITTGSDAVAVVVSEETGAISVAVNGSLRSRLSESELRGYLGTMLSGPAPIAKRLWRAPRKGAKTAGPTVQSPARRV
jgi:diadenylate cyclase